MSSPLLVPPGGCRLTTSGHFPWQHGFVPTYLPRLGTLGTNSVHIRGGRNRIGIPICTYLDRLADCYMGSKGTVRMCTMVNARGKVPRQVPVPKVVNGLFVEVQDSVLHLEWRWWSVVPDGPRGLFTSHATSLPRLTWWHVTHQACRLERNTRSLSAHSVQYYLYNPCYP